jgi:hypothetical protein
MEKHQRDSHGIIIKNLPDDYIEFSRIHHGGAPVDKVIKLDDGGELVFGWLFCFDEDKYINILEVNNDLWDEHGVPKEIIAFANSPFGDYYCFDYRESRENPKIVFYDHELDPQEEPEAIEYICDSFTDFLSRLSPYEDDE